MHLINIPQTGKKRPLSHPPQSQNLRGWYASWSPCHRYQWRSLSRAGSRNSRSAWRWHPPAATIFLKKRDSGVIDKRKLPAHNSCVLEHGDKSMLYRIWPPSCPQQWASHTDQAASGATGPLLSSQFHLTYSYKKCYFNFTHYWDEKAFVSFILHKFDTFEASLAWIPLTFIDAGSVQGLCLGEGSSFPFHCFLKDFYKQSRVARRAMKEGDRKIKTTNKWACIWTEQT